MQLCTLIYLQALIQMTMIVWYIACRIIRGSHNGCEHIYQLNKIPFLETKWMRNQHVKEKVSK